MAVPQQSGVAVDVLTPSDELADTTLRSLRWLHSYSLWPRTSFSSLDPADEPGRPPRRRGLKRRELDRSPGEIDEELRTCDFKRPCSAPYYWARVSSNALGDDEDEDWFDAPAPPDRPPFSFTSLIALAILRSGTTHISVGDIYIYFLTHFPYFKSSDCRSWRNSVRHVLSLGKHFCKKRPGSAAHQEAGPCIGKGSVWSVKGSMVPALLEHIREAARGLPHKAVARLGIEELESTPAAIAALTAEAPGDAATPKHPEKTCQPIARAQSLSQDNSGGGVSMAMPTAAVGALQKLDTIYLHSSDGDTDEGVQVYGLDDHSPDGGDGAMRQHGQHPAAGSATAANDEKADSLHGSASGDQLHEMLGRGAQQPFTFPDEPRCSQLDTAAMTPEPFPLLPIQTW